MSTRQLSEAVGGREWYHTLELAPGVVTPGWFDTRAAAARLPLPHDLSGRRCLDVGTFDGFWAFEMERRGASEVHAIDILDPSEWDWPADARAEDVTAIGARKDAGQGFEIARQALGSAVVRHERSIYDVTESELGLFDFVFVGSLLLHLRDPIGALTRLRSVCRDQLLLVDAINPVLSVLAPNRAVSTLDGKGRPWWWRPNVAGLVRMVEAAGFGVAGRPRVFAMPAGPGQESPQLHLGLLRHPSWLSAVLRARIGDPHAAIVAAVNGRSSAVRPDGGSES
jgi:tRNA (mo5U34)-methyltransferase